MCIWIVGVGCSSNRNASRDESVETGDEFVEARDEYIEARENTQQSCVMIISNTDWYVSSCMLWN